MEQRGRRTPALDSRTKLLLLPQTCSSPMRHHHPSSCPSPNLGDNLYSSLFRSWHIQTIGKSCHLCLGNLVGICLPLSNPSPDPLISSHHYLSPGPHHQPPSWSSCLHSYSLQANFRTAFRETYQKHKSEVSPLLKNFSDSSSQSE